MLDEESLQNAADELAARDPHLRVVIEKHGYPPLWVREPGFPTLVKIILEQQVSLSSAKAAYDKLLIRINPLTPRKVPNTGRRRAKTNRIQQTENTILSNTSRNNPKRRTRPSRVESV